MIYSRFSSNEIVNDISSAGEIVQLFARESQLVQRQRFELSRLLLFYHTEQA